MVSWTPQCFLIDWRKGYRTNIAINLVSNGQIRSTSPNPQTQIAYTLNCSVWSQVSDGSFFFLRGELICICQNTAHLQISATCRGPTCPDGFRRKHDRLGGWGWRTDPDKHGEERDKPAMRHVQSQGFRALWTLHPEAMEVASMGKNRTVSEFCSARVSRVGLSTKQVSEPYSDNPSEPHSEPLRTVLGQRKFPLEEL